MKKSLTKLIATATTLALLGASSPTFAGHTQVKARSPQQIDRAAEDSVEIKLKNSELVRLAHRLRSGMNKTTAGKTAESYKDAQTIFEEVYSKSHERYAKTHNDQDLMLVLMSSAQKGLVSLYFAQRGFNPHDNFKNAYDSYRKALSMRLNFPHKKIYVKIGNIQIPAPSETLLRERFADAITNLAIYRTGDEKTKLVVEGVTNYRILVPRLPDGDRKYRLGRKWAEYERFLDVQNNGRRINLNK